jgi:hypothetical protein
MTASKREGLIVRIQVKDERGRVIGEVDAVSLKGLLSLAHDEELRSIRTRLVELPSATNGQRAVVRALVRTKRGLFTGTGDATPENVNPEVAGHIIRVAESRAIARALRLAVNIGEVAIEELGARVVRLGTTERPANGSGFNAFRERSPDAAPLAAPDAGRPERFRGRDDRPTEAAAGDRRAMSGEQRKYLYRLAFQLGESKESSTPRVLAALGVERLEWATRAMASKAIDVLKAEVGKTRSNGHTNGQNGASSHG